MAIRRVEEIDDLVPVRFVFASVADKTGLDSLIPNLLNATENVFIVSTGGTYTAIRDILGDKADSHLGEVSEYTEMPETEGGLVKSLHHKLFLGYLTETYCKAHSKDLEREGARPVDLFIGNFYPFERAITKPGIDMEDARGQIDIGGPSAMAACAKNWHRVAVLSDPNDYLELSQNLLRHDGHTTLELRYKLHQKAFQKLAEYRVAIAGFMQGIPFEQAIEPYKIHNPSGGE
ncbi:MAG: hypothetical protein ABII01_05000 [Candidatus Woesearchaeota archaeon]